MTEHRFLNACRRKGVDRTPVWLMRQAGRYLPEYRAVRAKSDFMTMVHTPELAAEVTVQPVDILGVDAAIIFSDILVVPEAMGMQWEMIEARGPRFPEPVRTREHVDALAIADPEKRLAFVLRSLEETRRRLNGRVPLIGFSGSPWTLAAYMVEGGGSDRFGAIKRMMLDEPALLLRLLEKIAVSVRLYLEAQIAAGADAVQIFDTWGGILPPDHYRKFSLDFLDRILSRLHRGKAPVIVFSKGAHHAWNELASLGADVVGVDWTADLGAVRELTGDTVALQGNMDPSFLYASPEAIRREVRSILKKYGDGPGHVFNLGHGMLPDIPVENAKALVCAVQEESVRIVS